MLFGSRSRGISLVGDFAGHRDAGIAYRFRFCGDGLYFYLVEQPGRWRLAHRGKFQIGSVRDPKYDPRSHPSGRGSTLTIVRFEPQHHDVPLNDGHGFALLDERALLADRMEEYIVCLQESEDAWRPGVKRTGYNFIRPNPNFRLSSLNWHLEPVA